MAKVTPVFRGAQAFADAKRIHSSLLKEFKGNLCATCGKERFNPFAMKDVAEKAT